MTVTRPFLSLLALAAVGVPGTAQTTNLVTLPNSTFWQASNEPFAGSAPKRYQQWFSARSWQNAIGRPVRVVGMDLIAGTPGGQTGATIDVEITMANGPTNFPSQVFDQNMQSGSVVVVPRSLHTLNNAIPGSFPLQFNFKQYTTEFRWDGSSGVVVDVKMWDNGRGNNAAPFDLQATFSSVGQVQRMWGFGPDPAFVSTASFTQSGAGLALQFSYEDGASVPYGQGCAGAGGFVPVASTSGGLPLPANANWTHVLTQANAQMGATLIFGDDRTNILGVPLPLNLAPIAPLCDLLTNIKFTIAVPVIGSGPGAGTATVNVPVPPVTSFAGQSLFNQWVVLDSGVVSGLALSNGVWSIFG